ncbi:MAG: D-glycero-beta-D-manno-heptose-7-phosphate kinase [Candidatus Omnitrophota bacterium]
MGNKNKLKSIVSKFKGKNILVVGDLILDRHIFGKVERISPEAPVPVVWANRESFVCGGAANVGLNLKALGAKVSMCGVTGTDAFAKNLFSIMAKAGIDSGLVVRSNKRPTTLKTRIIANHQQIARVDWESIELLSSQTNKMLLDKIRKNINRFDAVVIEDYGKGVVNPILVKELVGLCRAKNKIVTVDPKEEHFDYYKNVTALTPNLKEAEVAAGMKVRKSKDLLTLGKEIMKRLNPKVLLITLGEGGMALFGDKDVCRIPTAALEVFDVTGAGDTVIAVFTLALSCGADSKQAAIIANFAAGIVVGKLGAATASEKELVKKINEARN